MASFLVPPSPLLLFPKSPQNRNIQAYGGEQLIKLTKDTPVVKDNAYQHHVTLGGFEVSPTDPTRAVVVATLDNLLKGAATQAMQVCVSVCLCVCVWSRASALVRLSPVAFRLCHGLWGY